MKNSARPRNSAKEEPRPRAAFSTAASTPCMGSWGMVEALVISHVPSASSTRRSVNVPPVSHERRTESGPLETEHLPRLPRCGHFTSEAVNDVDGSLHQRRIGGG